MQLLTEMPTYDKTMKNNSIQNKADYQEVTPLAAAAETKQTKVQDNRNCKRGQGGWDNKYTGISPTLQHMRQRTGLPDTQTIIKLVGLVNSQHA